MKLAKNLERLGTESAFKILAEAKKLEAEGNKIINLGIGQPAVSYTHLRAHETLR